MPGRDRTRPSSGRNKPCGQCRAPKGKRKANAGERARGLVWMDRQSKRSRHTFAEPNVHAAELLPDVAADVDPQVEIAELPIDVEVDVDPQPEITEGTELRNEDELPPDVAVNVDPQPEIAGLPRDMAVDVDPQAESAELAKVCNGCDRLFGDTRVLTIHQRKHCKALCRRQCADCDKVFFSKAALDGHRKVHREIVVDANPPPPPPPLPPTTHETRLQAHLQDVAINMPNVMINESNASTMEHHGTVGEVALVALSNSAKTAIEEFLRKYEDEYLRTTIMGRGLGLQTSPSTIRKYVDHARRVLLHVASSRTTSEAQLRVALGDCYIDDVIRECCLTPTTGDGRGKCLEKLRKLLEFAQVDFDDIISRYEDDAKRLAKQNDNVRNATRAFGRVNHLFTQGAGNASGTMGANPGGASNAIPSTVSKVPPLEVRMKVALTSHEDLLRELEAVEKINPHDHGAIIAAFLLVLSESHLPQRPTTYRNLKFGVPANPFTTATSLSTNAGDDAFWLVWSDQRGVYVITQLMNKIGADPFSELSPELTPLISAYLKKLTAHTDDDNVWGTCIFPSQRGTPFTDAGFSKFTSRHWTKHATACGDSQLVIMQHRHSMGDYMAANGITPRGTLTLIPLLKFSQRNPLPIALNTLLFVGDPDEQLLAQAYAVGMNTSTKQLCGSDVRHATNSVGAYNQNEVDRLQANVMASQHYRSLMFKACSGHLILPDFRHWAEEGTTVTSHTSPHSCFASAFELDPATQCVMVVLMSPTEEANTYTLDWNAAYMVPAHVCNTNLLQGIYQMAWNDRKWKSTMPPDQHEKHLQKATKSVHSWLTDKGVNENAPAKKEFMQASATSARDRLHNFFEGQIVLHHGVVVEVRGLEKNGREHDMWVLPYTFVRMDSQRTSTWRLRHGTILQATVRSSLTPVDWSWNNKTATVRVHI